MPGRTRPPSDEVDDEADDDVLAYSRQTCQNDEAELSEESEDDTDAIHSKWLRMANAITASAIVNDIYAHARANPAWLLAKARAGAIPKFLRWPVWKVVLAQVRAQVLEAPVAYITSSLPDTKFASLIATDIGKTPMPIVPVSRAQGLERVLRYYAVSYPEIGYRQGMCKMARMLFHVAGEQEDEVEVFNAFSCLLQQYGFCELFHRGCPMYHRYRPLCEKALERSCPQLYAHLDRYYGIDVFMQEHISKWFSSLFIDAFSLDRVEEMWDVIICDLPTGEQLNQTPLSITIQILRTLENELLRKDYRRMQNMFHALSQGDTVSFNNRWMLQQGTPCMDLAAGQVAEDDAKTSPLLLLSLGALLCGSAAAGAYWAHSYHALHQVVTSSASSILVPYGSYEIYVQGRAAPRIDDEVESAEVPSLQAQVVRHLENFAWRIHAPWQELADDFSYVMGEVASCSIRYCKSVVCDEKL